MYQRIRAWLTDVPVKDPIDRQQAPIMQIFLLLWIAIMAGIVLSAFVPRLLESSPMSPPPAQSGSALLRFVLSFASWLLVITPIVSLVLLRLGHFTGAVVMATLGFLVSHSSAVVLLGVGDGANLIMFMVPVVVAGLLGRRWLLLCAGAVVLFGPILVVLLQQVSMAGLLGRPPTPNSTGPTAMPSVSNLIPYLSIVVLVIVLLERFGGVLRSALRTSLGREAELETIRASLETMVTDRTSALQVALRDVEKRSTEQARLLAELESQRILVRDLSVPVIPISAKVLIMPLVGELDTERLEQVREQSLQAIERTAAQWIVIDITGVPIVDSHVAQGLLLTVRAARLLGTQVSLVGIRPEVAQSLVGVGIDLGDVRTFSDLESALNRFVG